jgi:hypothetical protein
MIYKNEHNIFTLKDLMKFYENGKAKEGERASSPPSFVQMSSLH